MTIDKHIYFSTDEILRIQEYCKNNKLSFSKAVCKLTNISLDGIDILDRLNTLEKDIDNITRILNIVLSLEKQIYSDMGFENISDPKNSKALMMFFKKMKGTRNDG